MMRLNLRKVDARLLWRDWRGGQLSLVVSALILAVMVVTAVSVLADRVERGLNAQVSAFLAADLAVGSGIALAQQYRDQAQQLGLQSADIAEFNSMIFAGDKHHLSSVKAVDQYYPLRGVMEITADLNAQHIIKTTTGPAKGEAWVEARLLNLIDIELGDFIEVGYSQLKVTHLIVHEPDRGTGFTSAGARVLMSMDDLGESQLIRPGSRVRYKFLMSGADNAIAQYQQWYQSLDTSEQNLSHTKLITPENAEEQLGDALQRGRSFLLLSGTIGVLLAGLAMALASHRYAQRLSDQVALMKAWGQSSRRIRQSQFFRLSLIALIATSIGMLLGWLAHVVLLEIARELFDTELPLPGWRPWVVAGVTGVLCVLGFALPALWHLPSVAPLKVLRRDLPDNLLGQGKRLSIGVGALMLLTLWYSGSLLVAVLFLLSLFALFAICALVAFQFLRIMSHLGGWRGSVVRIGLANLWRRRNQTLIQLVGFSTTLMLLLIVTGMRTSLISEWQAQLPADTPSHFIFNVASAELDTVQDILQIESLATTDWYPMVRGRLVAINEQRISPERLAQASGLSREVNFTQAQQLPLDNTILQGQWWGASPTAPEFSMEQEVAGELGVTIGDRFTFSVGGLQFNATLTSIRQVNWQSMNPNFYIVFSPKVLDAYAPNWITGVRAKDISNHQFAAVRQPMPFVTKIIQQLPTVVVLELSEVVTRIRNVIARVTQGLEMILLLVLGCGVLVLFAAIGVSYDERLRENAVLRALGSSRKMILGALTIEYAALGGIAGLIASIGGELGLYLIQTRVFELAPSWHPQLWLLGISVGVVFITALGVIRSREIINVPPLQSLRALS